MWFCATPTKSALQKQNKLNWKNPWRKTPTNAHRMLQELPSISRCCGDDSLGSLAGKQVSQWHQHQVRWRSVCVCSHPFMCKCVTFQKKPSTIWMLLYWMCFQSGWWRVKQRLQQAGTTTETMPPTETPPPTCMRWRIIAEVNGVSFLFIWCLCHDDLGLQQHWYRTLFRSHLGLIMRCNPEPHPVVSFHHHLFLTLMK